MFWFRNFPIYSRLRTREDLKTTKAASWKTTQILSQSLKGALGRSWWKFLLIIRSLRTLCTFTEEQQWTRSWLCDIQSSLDKAHVELPAFLNRMKVKVLVCLSHVQLFSTPWTVAHQTPLSMGFSHKNTGWVAMSSSRGSSWLKDRTWVSSIAGRFFTMWGTSEALNRLVQFSPVAQSCPTLCDPMNHSTPGLPVHHQLPEFTQTHVWVNDTIQPSHPPSSPSPPTPNPSQHQSLFQWVNTSHEVAKVLEFQL